QSVAIGLRIVEKLKGKSLDYAKSGIENPPSGNIDPQLIGHWESGGYSGGYYYSELFHWFFFENGTFYYYRVTTSLYAYSANYTVSNGRIYFTNVVFANDGYQEGYRNNEPDSYVDYEIFVEYFENRGQDVERLKIDNTGGCWTGSPTCNRASMDGFEDIGW
ncbi:MAG: hypothetical protein FWH48_07540, partial [Oscillospiraceae bacterium]|nr:hypothetical protein [Oscillospiraceae bacterium]